MLVDTFISVITFEHGSKYKWFLMWIFMPTVADVHVKMSRICCWKGFQATMTMPIISL